MSAHVHDIGSLLAEAATVSQGLDALAPDRCAAAVGLDGLAISLLNRSGLELVWHEAADTLGAALEDLQYTVGEGPTLDAARTGEPVLVPDLQSVPERRWPALLSAARPHPLRAVFALPLHLGAIRLGALTGHRATPGPLSRRQMSDTLALADAATAILLTPDGTHDMGQDSPLPLHRALIHQAAGALTVRLDLPIDQALARLRAYAFTHDRPILDVADDVIHHHSRLD